MTFNDDFTRPDSTNLGNGWVELAGDLSLAGFHVQTAPVAGNYIAAQPGVGGASETVSTDFTTPGTGDSPAFGLVLRCQDCGISGQAPKNYYRIYLATGNSGQLVISKVVGGTQTVLQTATTVNPTAFSPFTVLATANGTTLTIAVGAAQISVTDSTFAAGTVGMFLRSGGGVQQADNFRATVR